MHRVNLQDTFTPVAHLSSTHVVIAQAHVNALDQDQVSAGSASTRPASNKKNWRPVEAWVLGRRAVMCTGMERGWDYQNRTQDRTGAFNPIFIHQFRVLFCFTNIPLPTASEEAAPPSLSSTWLLGMVAVTTVNPAGHRSLLGFPALVTVIGKAASQTGRSSVIPEPAGACHRPRQLPWPEWSYGYSSPLYNVSTKINTPAWPQ